MGVRIFGIPMEGSNGFLDIMRGRARVLNLPEDATVSRLTVDPFTDRVLFLIESDVYSRREGAGDRIDEVQLLFERVPDGR